ncbi:hypothetical protein CGZ93_09690 [Enemella dayhoffiae]|uniref:Uncharacterized protein n=1 Tax=Enemella dayhoffiae TaxID=2016507 RepID=A0A255H3C4_9ACTN|nr:hypothetical protein [Enemella dayhoffiae]OYO22157.1 hypothetical protein CGZ93_09690 [Enemella dayhoffiae]
MAFYARPSWKLTRQVASDVFMVFWAVGWFLVSRGVHAVVSAAAEPARQTAAAATRVRDGFVSAAQSTGGVPVAGSELRKPFDTAATSMDDIITSANNQASAIEQLATVVALLVVLIPVAVLVAVWLPGRLRFHRASSAARRFIDNDADVDLFALRAMANQPMHELARISDDPVGEWRAGNTEVIRDLADLELRGSGLRLPKDHRAP